MRVNQERITVLVCADMHDSMKFLILVCVNSKMASSGDDYVRTVQKLM